MSVRPCDKSVDRVRTNIAYKTNKEWILDVYPDGRYGKRIRKTFHGTLKEARVAEQRLKYHHGDNCGTGKLGDVLNKKMSAIYFLRQGSAGPVKIGWTKSSIAGRLNTLQTGNPSPLQLIGYIPNKGRDTETALHVRFSKYKIRGEWFTPCVELLEHIEKDEEIVTF